MKKFLIAFCISILAFGSSVVYAQFIGNPNPININVYVGESASGTVSLLINDLELLGNYHGLPDWLSWDDTSLSLTATPDEDTRLGFHQFIVILESEYYGRDTAVFEIYVRSRYTPVTSISNVPSSMTVGSNLSLTGTVNPESATNRDIVWSITSENNTGASISGSTLTATNSGTVTVTATITNGYNPTTDFTQNFQIVVNEEETQEENIDRTPEEETTAPMQTPPWATSPNHQQIVPPTTPGQSSVQVPAPRNPFMDILENSWYYEYAIDVSRFFHGNNENTFNPNVNMTRAMFVVTLANLATVNTQGLIPEAFSDVSRYAWYGPSVAWASNVGIVNGIGYGLFAPNANITREQIAVMFLNFSRHIGMPLQSSTPNFEDTSEISLWALEAVGALSYAGVIAGRPDGSFDPSANVTRAETAAMFSRFANLMPEPGEIPNPDLVFPPVQEPVIVPRQPNLPENLN